MVNIIINFILRVSRPRLRQVKLFVLHRVCHKGSVFSSVQWG